MRACGILGQTIVKTTAVSGKFAAQMKIFAAFLSIMVVCRTGLVEVIGTSHGAL
jgi:hypothetical protein